MAERKFYLWQVRSFTVRIDLELIARLNANLAERRDKASGEVGGVLLGRTISPNEIEISGVEFVLSEHRRGIIYSLGLREQLSIAERVGQLSRKSGPKPVGFFRTHLRKGLFLDQDDFLLMQEAFGDPSQVALLIRPVESGQSTAGIFVWEEGDIDRRQTELLFPFDAETLRVQGPIESVAPPVSRAIRAPLRVPVRWMAWGAVTAASALALGAVLPKLHVRQQQPAAKPAAIAAITVQADMPEPRLPVSEPEPIPVAVVAEEKPSPIPFIAPTPDERASIPLPEPKPEQPKQIVTVLPPPLPAAVVAEKVIDPIPDPVLPARPTPEPVRPAVVRKPAFHIAVSLEPRQSSELKKVVGHVPLFGRLAHAEGGSDFSPARADTSLEPRVPANLASDLSGALAVDVRVSIDKHGLVTNSEVLQGAGTQLASLAASSVERASWQPAHEGDRNVNSEMIVHYRFQSAP